MFTISPCFQTLRCPLLEVAGEIVATGTNDIYKQLKKMNAESSNFTNVCYKDFDFWVACIVAAPNVVEFSFS